MENSALQKSKSLLHNFSLFVILFLLNERGIKIKKDKRVGKIRKKFR